MREGDFSRTRPDIYDFTLGGQAGRARLLSDLRLIGKSYGGGRGREGRLHWVLKRGRALVTGAY
jgi:hypothetical protein